MANLNSVNITANVATPAELSQARIAGQHEITKVGTIETTPVAGDTIQLEIIPVDAIITQLWIGNDDLATTSATMDVGFHQRGVDAAIGTVIDANALVTVLDMNGARAMSDLRFETHGIETISEAAWELANLSVKPVFEDMVLTTTIAAAVAGLAGTLSYRVVYIP